MMNLRDDNSSTALPPRPQAPGLSSRHCFSLSRLFSQHYGIPYSPLRTPTGTLSQLHSRVIAMTSSKLSRHSILGRSIAKRQQCLTLAVLHALHLYRPTAYRGPAIPRHILNFCVHIQGLSDTHFSRIYRITKPAFFKLANMITVARLRSGLVCSKTSPLLRLSLTLRWLAGGLYLDISHAHGVATSSFYFHLKQTLMEIDSVLKITFPYNDHNWLERTSVGFTRGHRSPLSGCSAALDGLAVKILEPSRKEVGNTSTYYNRKGFFAINLQAACDHTYRFLFVSGLEAGSTHDSTAFAMSGLARLMERVNRGLPTGFWIACDEAYMATINMLYPWPGRRLSREKDCFNYWLSSARIHIEQAFGLLVARWGVLWRPLCLKVAESAHLLIILCKLHNYILDETESLEVPPPSHMEKEGHSEDPDYRVLLQDECDRDDLLHRRRRDLESCDIRAMFTAEIKDAGLKRPALY